MRILPVTSGDAAVNVLNTKAQIKGRKVIARTGLPDWATFRLLEDFKYCFGTEGLN